MAETDNAAGTIERKAEVQKDESTLVRTWLEAIALSDAEEQSWRDDALKAYELYRASGPTSDDKDSSSSRKFNIFHSNVATICPTLYNSTPIPDVRRRFGDPDPVAKIVCDVQERCLAYSVDTYDFDELMQFAVQDAEIAGRGIDRVRYLPYVGESGTLDYEEVRCEHVDWQRFRRGPAKVWDELPWLAFELFLTRDELEKLSPELGGKVSLDVETHSLKKNDGNNVPEIYKRARVWEIWDKDTRQVIFIAPSHKAEPIRMEADPLGLTSFFPTPRPLYRIKTSTSLIPVVPYETYKAQAEELEEVSKRIAVLTRAIKARSIHDSRLQAEMEKLESSEDSDSVPIENLAVFADGSKLADHVMWYPIEVLVVALDKLYIAREQIKQTIYEITGVSDILRGQSDPNETLGAQQIKTQWGSMRLQAQQSEVQRYARDLFRLKAELIATKFQPKTLAMMTGIEMPPEAIALMQSDAMRGFRVDVESDSTIRADVGRNQQNMTQFLQGTAQFAQAMGPIVMAPQFQGLAPAVVEVFSSFARNFKLGKQAEDALEKVAEQAKQMAQQPPQPKPEEAQAAAEMKMAEQKQAHEMKMAEAGLQLKMQESQAHLELERQKAEGQMAMERERMAGDQALTRDKQELDHMAKMTGDAMNADAKAASSGTGPAPKGQSASSFNKLLEMFNATLQQQQQATQALVLAAQTIAAPKRIVRGPDGRVVGSVSETQTQH